MKTDEILKAAYRNEAVPEGLSLPEQLLFLGMRHVGHDYRNDIISREQAAFEKGQLLDAYRHADFIWRMSCMSAQMIKETENARSEYNLHRSLETADAMAEAIDGIAVRIHGGNDENSISG